MNRKDELIAKLTGTESSKRHWRSRHVGREHDRQFRAITRSWVSPRRAISFNFLFSGSPVFLITESLRSCGHFFRKCAKLLHAPHFSFASDMMTSPVEVSILTDFWKELCVPTKDRKLDQHFWKTVLGERWKSGKRKLLIRENKFFKILVAMLGNITLLRGEERCIRRRIKFFPILGIEIRSSKSRKNDELIIGCHLGSNESFRIQGMRRSRSSKKKPLRCTTMDHRELRIFSTLINTIVNRWTTSGRAVLRSKSLHTFIKGRDMKGKRGFYSPYVLGEYEMKRGNIKEVSPVTSLGVQRQYVRQASSCQRSTFRDESEHLGETTTHRWNA